jgi:hypothetical protein
MPLNKSIRVKKSTRSNTLTRLKKLKKQIRLTGPIGAGTTALAVIGIIVAAMLIGAHHRPSRPADIASVDMPPTVAATQPAAAKTATPTAVANAPVAETAAKEPAPASTPMTITGCLERSDETFRLKDTTGVNAPKSRSWKSGFLKKGSASIEVVDAANRLKDHVGQRVSVTGTLVDGEMHVRSVQRVAASCTNSPKVRV